VPGAQTAGWARIRHEDWQHVVPSSGSGNGRPILIVSNGAYAFHQRHNDLVQLSDLIAIYAAVLSTAAVVWQAVTYWDGRRPKLAVRCSGGFLIEDDEQHRTLAALAVREEGDGVGLAWIIDVQVVNIGRAKVQLAGVRLHQSQAGVSRGWDATSRAELPRWLEPGERWTLRLTDDVMPGVSVLPPFTVKVDTSAGRTFEIDYSLLDSGANSYVIMSPERAEQLESRSGLKAYRYLVEEI
jgi:hypothetical protein